MSGVLNSLSNRSWIEIAAQLTPEKGPRGLWMRSKFLVRAARYGKSVGPWFAFLETEEMAPIARRHPHLFPKVQWPYLMRNYTPAQRLEILKNHYRVALERLSPELIGQFFFSCHVELARWKVDATDTFSLRLAFTHHHRQEGEMALGLVHETTGRCCAFFHFTITGPAEISIGCLQGCKPVEDAGQISNQELHRAFKRKMHGMRHKSLLLFALRRLAACWGVTRIRAVSNATQLWSEHLQADYDAFWIEEGGALEPDGTFAIPADEPLDDFRARPKKRSMYRRRCELLEELGAEMEKALSEPAAERAVLDLSALAPEPDMEFPAVETPS